MLRNSQQIEDELLIILCQSGDEASLEKLIRRWAAPLHRHALRHTGSEDGAQETMQEAWLAIVQGLSRLEDPARFRSWAYRVVLNKSIDWVNRRRRDRDAASALHNQSQADTKPDASDTVAMVREALRRLPADRRSLLTMHYLDGLSVAELADVLAIPTGTVKSRLHHARREMQHIIERTEQHNAAPCRRETT